MNPAAFDLLLTEWKSAPWGAKTAVVERAAKAYGCSSSALYRKLNKAGHNGPKRNRRPVRPELRVWTQTLIELAHKSPKGTIPMDLCLRAAVAEGMLPPEAKDVSLSTYNRIAREEGYRQTKRRTRRLHADYPMQAVQFDASTSEHITVVKALGDSDYLLRLWRNPFPASGYKNKPLGPDRLRLVTYGLWDMHSGFRHARYTAALGENGLDAMEYLTAAFLGDDDPRQPFHGLPEDLWSDQGPLVKHAATRDLLGRLGVNPVVGKPYNKERMGGIEGNWGHMWRRFEASLFLLQRGRERVEFSLTRLNAMLCEYLIEMNGKTSRNGSGLSRKDAWVQGVNRMGGVRECPPDPLETLATEVRRTLDQSGIFSWNTVEYIVSKLHSCRIIARRALDGSGRVIVEHPGTHERYEAKPWGRPRYGEHKGSPKLPAERAKEQGADRAINEALYAPQPQTNGSNVTAFPPRTKEAADLPDPLDASKYHSLTEAWAKFREIYPWPIDEGNRALIEGQLTAAGLRKDAVRDLAMALQSLTQQA